MVGLIDHSLKISDFRGMAAVLAGTTSCGAVSPSVSCTDTVIEVVMKLDRLGFSVNRIPSVGAS